ncbi:MAG: GIY-YIG nuclease family protein [Flavobacteriales bacterium]|nr:GIY-YIG nuclease family protein [Flavobacteriales bacterium]
MKDHNYFVYVITNKSKSVLYTGVTNDLIVRLHQHREDALGNQKHFAGRYSCYYLLFFERFGNIDQAIAREKQIKGWKRERKIDLISSFNKDWKFLNDTIEEL